MSILVGRV